MSPVPRTVPSALVLAALLVALLAALLAGCAEAPTTDGRPQGPSGETVPPATATEEPSAASTVPAPTVAPELALAGTVVVLDPGHQLGNRHFPEQVGRTVDAGGFGKPCNTTGTSTDAGYPEPTLTWQVARLTRRLLHELGARVLLTRSTNSEERWGPCVDERGRAGNPDRPGPTADVKISIHADGSRSPGAQGFHVIAPEAVEPWTTDIAAASLRLAEVVRDALVDAGLSPATYAGSRGIDLRDDLGTLNLSDVPAVMVELGNMRDAGDAAFMGSRSGRWRYASALAAAVERFLAL